ncbi:hypothetical protein GW765_03865 [Candidatus Parcubacteria bacterium]|nr:hypothetical protein [Candidatus Parcubacteria bacterium]
MRKIAPSEKDLTPKMVINSIKKISPETHTLEEFKLLTIKVDRHLKSGCKKELQALNLFLLKVERARYSDELNGFYKRLNKRKREFQTRLNLEKQEESGSNNFLTQFVEDLLEAKKVEISFWFVVIVSMIGLLVYFFTPIKFLGVILVGLPPLAFLCEKWESKLKSK